MFRWRAKLDAGGTLVLDGGTGTELRRRGAPWGDASWSALAGARRPDLLVAIHRDFIAAGADIITANTFGATRFVLESAGCDDVAAVGRGALAAAREARERAGRDVAIAASLSCLPPAFDPSAYPAEPIERAAYVELAKLAAAEGADLMALEMLEDDRHAVWACEAAAATGLPVWAGVSARLAPDGRLVAFDYPGTPLYEVIDAVLEFDPFVVNVMHTPPRAVGLALALLRSRWAGRLGAYPEIDSEPRASGALSPAELAALATGWIDAGARVIGGCCGTTPVHVRALADLVAAREGH